MSRRFPKDSILFVSIGSTIGKCGVARVELTSNQQINAIFPSISFSADYLFYAVSSAAPRIKAQAGEQAVPIVNKTQFSETAVALPPLPEQRAIATALSDVDGLLGGLDRLIAKKRDLKQAAMQQLLTGQTRLPGFQGEWEVKRLGDVAPLQRGFDLPNPQLKSGPYPVVYSNGIMNHHAAFQVKGPGVVTGRSGTIGKVTFVEDDYWPHNTSLWVTNFKGNDPKFIFYLYTRLGFERFASGSGVPTLNRNDAHSYQVLIPPTKAEQTAIASVLSEMDGELALLEQRREKTRALKQAMMQELLTGRTRLK
jgi:type I restriction enzyme S subunit